MRSRTWTTLASLALTASAAITVATLAGCRIFPKEPAPLRQNSSSPEGCLTGSGAVLDDFMSGKASVESVQGVFDCASTTLKLFVERTQGASTQHYTMRELRTFTQHYFLHDFSITDAMLSEMGLLKQTLLGGSPTELTLREVQHMRQLLTILKEEVSLLLPLMPLTAEHYNTLSVEEIDHATDQLFKSAQRVGSAIRVTAYPYSFTHLDRLLHEVQRASDASKAPAPLPPGDPTGTIRTHIPLLRAVKSAFIDHEPDRISPEDWSTFLTTAAKWHRIYLLVSQFASRYFKGEPDLDPVTGLPLVWSADIGRERFIEILHEIVQVAEVSISKHPEKAISFPELDQLIDTLAEAIKPTPLPLTPTTLKDLLRPLFGKILKPSNETGEVVGITARALRLVMNHADRWSDGQRFLEQLFERMGRASGAASPRDRRATEQTASAIMNFGLDQVIDPDDPRRNPTLAVARDLLLIVASPHEIPLIRADGGLPLFDAPRDGIKRYNYWDLSQKNLLYTGSRIIGNGYRRPGDLTPEGFDRTDAEGFKTFYREMRKVFVELHLFLDEEDLVAMDQRFREANLFTFAGNGDSFVDTRELAQMLTLLIAAKRVALTVHEDAVREGHCGNGQKDAWDLEIVKTPCFAQTFFAHFPTLMANMPKLVDYHRSLGRDEKRHFETSIQQAALGKHFDTLSSAYTQSFPTIGFYIEAMFNRYDTNLNGTIDLNEARQAFPVYRGAIAKAYKALMKTDEEPGENRLWGVFTFFLHAGRPPTAGDYIWWSVRKPLWKSLLHSNRSNVADIFAYLNTMDQSGPPPPK